MHTFHFSESKTFKIEPEMLCNWDNRDSLKLLENLKYNNILTLYVFCIIFKSWWWLEQMELLESVF